MVSTPMKAHGMFVRVIHVALVVACAMPLMSRAADDRRAQAYFGQIAAACPDKAKEETCIGEIRQLLLRMEKECVEIERQCEPGQTLLRRIFGDTHRDSLADLVVYWQQSTPGTFNHHRPAMMWRGKLTPYLYGVRDVYVLIFTEFRSCVSSFLRTEYKSEPNPFSGLFGLLGKSVAASDGSGSAKDKAGNTPIGWISLTGRQDSPLWMAVAPGSVDVNSVNRVNIRYDQPKRAQAHAPGEGQVKNPASPSAQNITPSECEDESDSTASFYQGNFVASNAFFSNSPDSYATFAIAIGATRNVADTSLGPSSSAVNGYGLVKFYVPGCEVLGLSNFRGSTFCERFLDWRPRLKAGPGDTNSHSVSLGLVVGTNVFNSAFSELLVGVSLGHVVGNVGIIVGRNYLPGTTSHPKRHQRPFVGLDYSF
jgi:hypothetical protein